MPDVVRVNQTLYSWNSTEHLIDFNPYTGIVAVDYDQKRARKVVYAARQDGVPLGMTTGKYEVPPFSLKMLRDSANTLLEYLTNLGNGSYGDAVWDYTLTISDPDPANQVLTVSIESCVISGKKDAHEEGIDELLTEFEITPLVITENGMQLWSAQRALNNP